MQDSNETLNIDQDLAMSRDVRRWAEKLISTLDDLSELQTIAEKVDVTTRKLTSVEARHNNVARPGKNIQSIEAGHSTTI